VATNKSTHAEFLQGARTLIENAAGIPELAGVLSGYGYDQARFAQGLALMDEAESLARKQAADHGGKREATQERSKAWELANGAYAKTLKVARMAFSSDAKAVAALKLLGPRKMSMAGWYDQASTFYDNLSAEPRFLEGLGRFGYGPEKIAHEKSLVERVRDKAHEQTYGTGSAQASTAARDRKLRELDTWVTELRTICRIAFYETPQELEKLGVLALNRARRKKADKADNAKD